MGKNDQGLNKGRQRYQTVLRVLVFLRNGSDVLLLKGAPDKTIWANLYNGVGGHVEAEEDILSAARREVLEETGLEVDELALRAVVNIDVGNPLQGILMFAFVGWVDRRETVASAEGALDWIAADEVTQHGLVEDLYWLLPRVLALSATAPPLYLHYRYDGADRLVIRTAADIEHTPRGDLKG
ncbi:MAG: NUDIX domain-containing protein [Candidatus Promineifilaceae bacterium]|nr:NUDIX domain-containing protein [Candidatus Promineifilaceae bacterium]